MLRKQEERAETERKARDTRRLNAALQVIERVAAVLQTNESLVEVSGGRFDKDVLGAGQYVTELNRADAEWRRARPILALHMKLQYQQDEAVTASWNDLQLALEDYSKNVHDLYLSWSSWLGEQTRPKADFGIPASLAACIERHSSIADALDRFTTTLQKADIGSASVGETGSSTTPSPSF
jgi:hypothetical protein